jgi:putative restriction endonuclease
VTAFEEIGGPFRAGDVGVDDQIRAAAFAEIRRLTQLHGDLSSEHLQAGFQFAGRRVPFVNPQRGIFKPKLMRHLLSIRTVFPRQGRRIWYDDQREVHQQIFNGEESIEYSFMGQNPDAADNRWLREAMLLQIPIIYFLGTAPGVCQAIIPTFVVDFDASSLKARIAFAESSTAIAAPQSPAERRYALRQVKQRLHQASFREMVIAAYDGRCAISGLPERLLLDAAHIMSDRDEEFGQPHVSNGIPLSKIHHAAFDAQLIGIDPDYKIHVSEKLLSLRDGPTLEALRQFNGKLLRPPRRSVDMPDRDRLAMRFERFKSAA